MKKTFIFYNDWIDYTEEMNVEEKGLFFETILKYQNGLDIGNIGSIKFIWSRIKKQLDEDNLKYDNICERNKINGLKGGRPKKIGIKQKANKPTGLTGNPKNLDNDNDNDNDNKEKIYKKEIYGEYKNILLTKKEKYKLIEDFGLDKFNKYLKILDEGIEMKGYKYKSHNLAIRSWIRNDDKKKNKGKLTYQKDGEKDFLEGLFD